MSTTEADVNMSTAEEKPAKLEELDEEKPAKLEKLDDELVGDELDDDEVKGLDDEEEEDDKFVISVIAPGSIEVQHKVEIPHKAHKLSLMFTNALTAEPDAGGIDINDKWHINDKGVKMHSFPNDLMDLVGEWMTYRYKVPQEKKMTESNRNVTWEKMKELELLDKYDLDFVTKVLGDLKSPLDFQRAMHLRNIVSYLDIPDLFMVLTMYRFGIRGQVAVEAFKSLLGDKNDLEKVKEQMQKRWTELTGIEVTEQSMKEAAEKLAKVKELRAKKRKEAEEKAKKEAEKEKEEEDEEKKEDA